MIYNGNINYLFFVFLLLGLNPKAQEEVFLQKSCIINSDTIKYRLLVPKDYDEQKKYPMLVFLHGAGERGNDNKLQLIHGSTLFSSKKIRKKFNSFVVFPQCPKKKYWATIIKNNDGNFKYSPNPRRNLQLRKVEFLLKDLENIYNIDKNRIYVGGLSMGGMGTYELVYRNPNKFAAAFSICGGANPKIAEKISSPAWFIYHGKEDKVVPIEHSKKIVAALKEINANVNFTQYENVYHNSWDMVFKERNFLKSIFKQTLEL
tara:strand:+ start:1402 stop:2184 length:783 start_codon:yes stop_codon:yes gene_type:complete